MKPADQDRLPTDRLLWTAAVVAGASVPHWPMLPPWIPVLLFGCIAWRLAALLLGWPLPRRAVRLVFAFAAFSAVLMQYRTINGVSAGSALLVVMVAMKFLESHTQRDQMVLMIIAYFLVFASLLYPQSVMSGVYLLVFAWITTVGMLQLGRGGPLLPNLPTARFAARLLLQAVPIMVVLFLLFPRLPGPLWAIPGATSSGSTGLSGSMSPGDITSLGLSDDVAFRAEFVGRAPKAQDLYWRGPVLSSFNGRTWTREPGMRGEVADTLEFLGSPVQYRVMLEPNGRHWAFALDMPSDWDSSTNIVMGSDYQLRAFFADPVDNKLDYTVTSYTRYRAREDLSDADRERLTRLPEGSNPRTRAMVDEWLASNPSPEELIAKALNVFRGEQFYYTLTPLPLGRNTADDFIFETREGFCEHYASAFTIMLRAAGIPARVVTGYQGGELNGIGRYYMIRQSDAHAWTEAWLEGSGWVRVDPIAAVAPERIALGSTSTPLTGGAAIQRGLARMSWVRTAALAWDTVNTYWNDWVVGYGPRLQRVLARALGIEHPHWRHLVVLATVTTALLLVALSVYLAWTFRARRKLDRASRCFARFSAKLARIDVEPPGATEMPADYAARAGRRVPRLAAEIDRVVGAYLSARYEPDERGESLLRFERLVEDFRPAKLQPR